MATSEHQTQPIIGAFNATFLYQFIRLHRCSPFVRERVMRRPLSLIPAHRADELSHRDSTDPGGRVFWGARFGPRSERRGESVLQRVFGKVDRATNTNQPSDDAAKLPTEG